jgi:hypothetical protein
MAASEQRQGAQQPGGFLESARRATRRVRPHGKAGDAETYERKADLFATARSPALFSVLVKSLGPSSRIGA